LFDADHETKMDGLSARASACSSRGIIKTTGLQK